MLTGSKKRRKQVLSLADALLEKIGQSVQELDRHEVTVVTKVKQVSFDNPDAPNKATGELTTERKSVEPVEGLIDRDGIKKLTSALKELQTILDGEETERTSIFIKLDEKLKNYGK